MYKLILAAVLFDVMLNAFLFGVVSKYVSDRHYAVQACTALGGEPIQYLNNASIIECDFTK